jgi:hypothetical protein
MRTTIAIDDRLLSSAKRRARQRGLTLGQLIEESLRRELAGSGRPAPGPEVPVFRGGSGVRPGVDVSSNRGLLEALDEGRGIEQIR